MHGSNRSTARRQAFTLVELMVVMAIAAIVVAITMGGYRGITDGNRRTSCQSNLVQIYQACRLYSQDYNGRFPYYNPGVATVTGSPNGGIGLWALYTYPSDADRDGNGWWDDLPVNFEADTAQTGQKPISSYIRSPKILHCPADNYGTTVNVNGSSVGALSSELFVDRNQTPSRDYNPSYLSYQQKEDGVTPTYSLFRAANEKRQLFYYNSTSVVAGRAPGDTTVVAWCRFHRNLSTDGATTVGAYRNFDNVLFYDGTVQLIPRWETISPPESMGAPCETLSATCVDGWLRVPKGK